MDNSVLRTAMVTHNLNKTVIADLDTVTQYHSDAAETTLAERAAFGVDRRTVAIGGSEEFWMIDLLRNPTREWMSVVVSMNDSVELMLGTKKPKNILALSAGMVAGAYAWINENPGTKLTLINDYQLDMYEQHMMPQSDVYTVASYDVIDHDDLRAGVDDKFDFILSLPWDIMSDREVQKLCVDSLAPGGILFVALTNNGTKLYRDDFHTHPYADMHKFLHSCDGLTYHNPALYGFTVFIKN